MADHDDDMADFDARRQHRVKITAWVVIGALILTGGGATLLALVAR